MGVARVGICQSLLRWPMPPGSSESEDPHALSIESRLEAFAGFATVHEIEVGKELTENAFVRNPERPICDQPMKRVRDGNVKGVLPWSLDRLARNMVGGGH
jgi:hypothetical protein